jgi:non-ribosomal peptide synthetase component F/thioesterase domain-containing protein
MTDPSELRRPEEVASPDPRANLTEEDFFAFPLSPVQERMWRADRQNPGNPAYNGSFRWILEGPLDPALVERTFNEIIRRHEALRTTFSEEDGSPVQIVSPSFRLQVSLRDLRALAPQPREEEMDRLCAEEACRPFNVEKDELIRVGLLRMEDRLHILMLTMHHLVSDGWSVGLIMEEFQKIYGAFAEGKSSPLPELPIQYPDYVVWKQDQSAGAENLKQLAYWKDKLRGYRRLEVRPDFPRPAKPTTRGAIASKLLPRELTDALKEFSNQHGGSMFITSLSACLALLSHYTGENDVAVGSPLAGRNRPDVENLVGLFMNHVVLRASTESDPSFVDFMVRVREAVWDAFANQDVPFEHVVKALPTAGQTTPDPFFLVNFICQREYARASEFVFEFAGIKMSTMPSKSQGALYDLNFFLVEREAGWRLSIEYNTDLYRELTVQKMLEDFEGLLEAVAKDPNRTLSELCSIASDDCNSATEQSRAAANDGTPGPSDSARPATSAHEMEIYAMPASAAQERFWLLSKFAPGNAAFHMPACVRLTGPLSEKTLDESFRILVGRHEILRTSFEEIDGQLSQIISPAGNYALEIATLHGVDPAETEATVGRLVREEAERPFDLGLGPVFRAKLLRLDDDHHVLVVTMHHIIADGWSHNVFQNELWTIYEAISHGANPVLPDLPIQYGDFTAWQREWLASDDAREQLEFWTARLSRSLTVLDFPTNHPPSHRISLQGGLETLLLPQELTRALKSKSQSENVTMFMLLLAGFVTLLSRYANQPEVIVGSPVANRRPETEPLIGPFSGPVAIHVDLSGNPPLRDVLAKVRDATLNALAHAELPFEVLLDKLKVRSVHGRNPLFQFYFFYQTAFLQPRQLQQLTVTPMSTFGLGTPFEMQMGIIERAEGVRLQLEYNAGLFERTTIQRVLEDYRGILEAMLANPAQRTCDLQIHPPAKAKTSPPAIAVKQNAFAPRNETEKKLAELWENLLGVQPIGIEQNYFELGGNSLLAVRLFARIQKEFSVNLPLATLFEAQTIAGLASVLDNKTYGRDWSPLVPIQTLGTRPPFFCIHGGGGSVLIYRALSQHLGADQPFYGLESQGLDGRLPLLTKIEDMAELYVRELRRVQPHGPYFLGGYCMGGTVALEVAQQLTAAGEKVALLALFDTANWAAIRRNVLYDKMVYQAQRIVFHCLNFGLLDFKKQVEFIQEKLRVLWNRSSVWRGWFERKLGSNSEFSTLAKIWDVNDRAILAYRPKPYPGTITDFRPMSQYFQYLGEPMDWSGLAQKHEIVTLRVYPAGMLLEPFVQDLARALGISIQKAIGQK